MSMTSPVDPPLKLMDQVRGRLRVLHYAYRTEQSYVDWILRFIRFHGKRHPSRMEAEEIEAFLTHLAVAGKVASSAQNFSACFDAHCGNERRRQAGFMTTA